MKCGLDAASKAALKTGAASKAALAAEAASKATLAVEAALKAAAAAQSVSLTEEMARMAAEIAELKALVTEAMGAGLKRVQRAPEGQLMRCAEVTALLGVNRSTLWRMVRAGKFPAAINISSNRVGWRRAEVEGWLAARKAA